MAVDSYNQEQKEVNYSHQTTFEFMDKNDFEPLPLEQIQSSHREDLYEMNQSISNHQQKSFNPTSREPSYHLPSIQPQEQTTPIHGSPFPLQYKYQESDGGKERTVNMFNGILTANKKDQHAWTTKKKKKVHKLEMPSRDELKSYWEKSHVLDEHGMLPLHKACALFPQNSKLIGMVIRGNSNAVCTPVQQPKKGEQGPGYRNYIIKGEQDASPNNAMYPKQGSYPIHIAITNNASFSMIKLLVRAGPRVLSKKDGAGLVPLSLALRCESALSSNDHSFYDLIMLLLSANQGASKIPDNRMQTPLHYACMSIGSGAFHDMKKSSSSSQDKPSHLNILKLLVEANPEAIHQQNFNGRTPLELAQYGDKCDDECIAYLQKVGYNEEVFEEIDV
jgi:hypothetical protein